MMPLAACGNKAVATTSGGKITQDEYYSSMKSTSQGKAVLQQMILDKVLQKQYGNEVSKSAVNKEYNSYKSQYGSSFSAVLEQQGLTEKSFKDQIKSRLLLEAAVRHYSTFSNNAINKQWKKYEPKVQTAEILVGSEDEANDIINQLNSASGNKYKKFKKLAKSKSTDTSNKNAGGVVPAFDNTSSSVDSAYKKAAFKLKAGEYTKEPVKTDNGYQIIYMVKHPAKGAKSAHIADLKTQIVEQNMNNQSFMEKVISKVLKKGNVSIKDKDLQNILSQYLNPSANNGAATNGQTTGSSSSNGTPGSSDASSSSNSN